VIWNFQLRLEQPLQVPWAIWICPCGVMFTEALSLFCAPRLPGFDVAADFGTDVAVDAATRAVFFFPSLDSDHGNDHGCAPKGWVRTVTSFVSE